MLAADGLWELIEKRADASPDALFALDEAERQLSFAEYRDTVRRCAAGLHVRGVGVDARVSWQLPTSIDALVLCGALARLGAIQNPILPIYREREVDFVVRQLESTLLILRAEDAARLDAFVGVVDDTLRTEDALHALSEDAVLLLLVGTAPEHARLALRRLDGALRAAGVKTDSICGELVKLDRVRDREGWESTPKAPRSWSELLSP